MPQSRTQSKQAETTKLKISLQTNDEPKNSHDDDDVIFDTNRLEIKKKMRLRKSKHFNGVEHLKRGVKKRGSE